MSARYGHVLPLALGFPLETTIAVTRAYLSGVFDRYPDLEVLLAHSGGTLPFLAGRIQSCVEHEREFRGNGGDLEGPSRSIWDVLNRNIYLDAVCYGAPALRAAVASAGEDGPDRLLFGTDHPFFPPLRQRMDGMWASVKTNVAGVQEVYGEKEQETMSKILGGNAIRILKLDQT